MVGQKLVEIRFFLALYFYSIICVFIEYLNCLKRKLSKQKLFDEEELNDLTDCVCLINGASCGSIGRIVIQKLLNANCFVIITLHGDQQSVKEARSSLLKRELKGFNPSLFRFEYLDLISLDSILKFVHKLNNQNQTINFFISNSGIALKDYKVSDDEFESQLQINYLGGCLLLIGLLPLLAKTAKQSNQFKSKIVFTSSCAHKFVKYDLNQLGYATNQFKDQFSTHRMYPASKLFQLMFNYSYFNQFIKKNGLNSIISFINIHPGIVDTRLYDDSVIKNKLPFIYNLIAFFMKRPEEGAFRVSAPILLNDKFFESTECLYLEDLRIASMNRACYDYKLKEELYEHTIALLKPNIEQFNLPNQFNPLKN